MPALKKRRCPQCKKSYGYVSFDSHKPYPFCSERCRVIDLGAWFDEEYAVKEDISNDLEVLREEGLLDDLDGKTH